MSKLLQIPIAVETGDVSANTGTIGGGVSAILAEIANCLEQLADGGEPTAIDLRSLPMSPDDRRQLLEALGQGEATITLQVDGESVIRETGIAGVWWTEHRNRDGDLLAAFIEIAQVPTILPVETEELRRGAQRLSGRAAGAKPAPVELLK